MNKKIEDAKNELSLWLSHPSELGKFPRQIVFTKEFEDEDGIQCMIFKYKKSMFSPWFLGIVSESGTFSEMKEYVEATEIEDASEILNLLKEYWKNLAKQYEREA